MVRIQPSPLQRLIARSLKEAFAEFKWRGT
ncbi:MAG: hypothetical protein IIY06_09060 [Proteobacteria bacterium]|nr:hypothetical protein [Pseudomonadota bacterium]